MAKKSKVIKSLKLKEKRQQYLQEYKQQGKSKLNRVSTRGKNRCKITGRPRGYMGYFGLSRITFRELANKGELPGVVRANK
jgi:small subunit ribosomal protein S14